MLALAMLALAAARSPAPALAAANLGAMIEDDSNLAYDPAGTLEQFRILGANVARLDIVWAKVAPNPLSRQRPRHFNAADPADYPSGAWASTDAIVTAAQQYGITLNVDLDGGAPIWATGPGAPSSKQFPNWEPSPREFARFVHAVGLRYSGSYTPPGASAPLPRLSYWSVWNEPDYGPSLAPQGLPGHLRVEYSPRQYRNLVNAAWSALHATGHGHDTFIIGELAPRGKPFWGVFSGMKPLHFLRTMYCLDQSYRELRGSAAAIRGCPTTPGASRRFRSRNPGLFQASGFADHPYMRWYPPNRESPPDPDYSSLGEIGGFERALDRVQRVYGSHKRYPIYNTEFGYITDPPKHHSDYPWVSQTTAAYYLNWAEYISWRDPRIVTFNQYLLADPLPALSTNDWGGFASGLLNYDRTPKAGYYAWRLPLYLPVISAHHRQQLEVWGCARPAPFAQADTAQPQSVEIQYRRHSHGAFTTLQTVQITNPRGYFDVHMTFPATGSVRLAWAYPPGDPLLGNLDPGSTLAYSRQVQVTIH